MLCHVGEAAAGVSREKRPQAENGHGDAQSAGIINYRMYTVSCLGGQFGARGSRRLFCDAAESFIVAVRKKLRNASL